MPLIVIVILMYHRHTPIDSFNLWGDVMCFLWGTDKPVDLIYDSVQNCDKVKSKCKAIPVTGRGGL
jgi:hypothetical protein